MSSLIIFSIFLFGAAVFLATYKIQTSSTQSAAEDRLVSWDESEKKLNLPIYIKVAQPLLKGPKLDLAVSLWGPKRIAKWKSELIRAGVSKSFSASEFVAAKLWITVFIFIACGLILAFKEEPPSPLILLGMIATAFFYPNIHISGLKKARQQSIRLALPNVIDLLTLCTEAGLDFLGSIGKIVERSKPSPMVEELSEFLKDVQLGKTRSESLKDFANRIDISETTSLVSILTSSDKMGASIGTVLRAQSDSMRNIRINKAEKMGAEASQKILIPLVLFIMPAVMLIIFGPMVIKMIGG